MTIDGEFRAIAASLQGKRLFNPAQPPKVSNCLFEGLLPHGVDSSGSSETVETGSAPADTETQQLD